MKKGIIILLCLVSVQTFAQWKSYYPEGKEDDTHLSVLGATEVAKLALEQLKEKLKGFESYIKTDSE